VVINKLMPNYGWVQNTSNLSTVRDALELVDRYGIKHSDLMGKIRQKREDDGNLPSRWSWDTRCRIKALQAMGLVNIDRNIQGYIITDLGIELLNAPIGNEFYNSKRVLTDEEKQIFKKALLTSVPVNRVLKLFKEDMDGSKDGLSKYDIGEKLGIVGDEGFTHLNPSWVVSNGFKFNNKEGDADKWARTMISWLEQVEWIRKCSEKRDVLGTKLQIYESVEEIRNILRYDAKRTRKQVLSEMLCSNHHPLAKNLQLRRAKILEVLQAAITIESIVNKLIDDGIQIDNDIVHYELINLEQIGFEIRNDGMNYVLVDRIKLDINPILLDEYQPVQTTGVEKNILDAVLRYQSSVPPKLVDNLIRYGNDGTKGQEFESVVADYFTFLGYETTYLGQGRGRVADVIAKYRDTNYQNSYAVIVDAKATNTQYNFPAPDIRKMKEYINEHGMELLHDLIPRHSFSFVSSSFSNPNSKVQEIASDTAVNGCYIKVDTLLELGEKVSQGVVSISTLYGNYIVNDEFAI
jgi:hypothetical protein